MFNSWSLKVNMCGAKPVQNDIMSMLFRFNHKTEHAIIHSMMKTHQHINSAHKKTYNIYNHIHTIHENREPNPSNKIVLYWAASYETNKLRYCSITNTFEMMLSDYGWYRIKLNWIILNDNNANDNNGPCINEPHCHRNRKRPTISGSKSNHLPGCDNCSTPYPSTQCSTDQSLRSQDWKGFEVRRESHKQNPLTNQCEPSQQMPAVTLGIFGKYSSTYLKPFFFGLWGPLWGRQRFSATLGSF